MKKIKKGLDELNYKQAYTYLFNQVTDMIEQLQIVQETAENICIDETPTADIKIDIDTALEKLVDYVKENRSKQK